MSLPGKKSRTGKGKLFWMHLVAVILPLITITTCVAYQGHTLTTVTPPPHRGAARQMYGSGSLRPPGTNPALLGNRQQLGRSYPSTPPPNLNMRNYPVPMQGFPYDLSAKDITKIYEMYFPDFYRPNVQGPKYTRTQNRGGGLHSGRPDYPGMPIRRLPIDGGFRVGMDGLPDIMEGRYSSRRVNYGTPKLEKMMREPSEEWKGGDVDVEHQCGGECDVEEFLCLGSCTCIKNTFRCDGDVDCTNEEDELECGEIDSLRNTLCEDTEKYVRCPRSGKCILKSWLCDGDDDCGDYSDETQCGSQVNCTVDQFECTNGLCIPKTWTCDNDNDCKDFSDEMNCTKIGCTENEFTCTDGSCISLSWKCDRQQDCNDNSDEVDCEIEAALCYDGEFQCTYQKCIKKEFRCDGDNDCGDWSDEDNCPKSKGTCGPGEFKCSNGRCIPESWKCDKQDDCEGNEDEINCTKSATRSCTPEEYTCNSGACILKTWVCDGFSDCSADEDESECHIVCDQTKFACSGINPNDTRTEFCINKKHVCDGQRDCPKGEDEIDCPTRHDCNSTTKCTQICITTADKKETCACHPGYNLSKDGYSCDDINECLYETDPVCSQTCNNTIGSFVCGCMTGYILRPDLRTCKALGAQPTLLFANRIDIRQVSLSNSKYTAILKGLHNAIALDYHYNKGLIFWSDVSMDVIRRAHVNESGSTGAIDVIKWGLESPGGVALDWVHDLIFWTDSGTRRVEVATIDGKQRAILVAKELDKPRAIVVHPGQAFVFWTDWGPNPKIERIEMDGSNRKSIITESVFWPNGLTLDYTNNRIYWADAKHNVIETSLYDGSDRKKVISKGLPHPFALTIFEDAIYWTDWHTKAISTANKATGAGFRIIHSNLHFPMDIHSYHPQRQPEYKNHCGNNNGGCEHLCLPNKKSFSCRCRMGLKLNTDGKTCMTPENLLIFARKKDLRLVHIGNDAGHNNEIVIPVDGIKSAVAITWDSRTDTIFWTDVEKDTINKVNWNGSNQEVIIKNNIASPAGLAYDWITDKLYWTDAGTAKIEVAKSDGSIRALLIWEGLEKPRDIVVDPTAGYMYWSDWGEIPKIERAAMDGTMRTMIVSQNLTWPNGLAIDYNSARLYWTDAGTNSIEYSNLDGTNRKVLLSGPSLPHPFGLDVFGDDVYWTDWNSLKIEKVDKNTGMDRRNITTGVTDLMDVRVFHRNRKDADFKSECLVNNGGCSHLCLLKPQGHGCACPVGIKIEPDGKSCKEGPLNSLILAHRVDIRQISLDVPYTVDVVLPFTHVKNVVSVDVDRKTGEMYWSDTSADVIEKNTLNGKNPKLILAHELVMADGIAIDSNGRKMYWTDGRRNSIEVAELDGTNRKLLISYDLDTPRAITLHYHLGLIFWSDWGKNAKIEVAEMDGTNRKALITTKLIWPNGLAIDRPAERLYWDDGKLKTIESCDLKGNDRRVIMTDVPHPYGLVVVGNHIYWTDWHTESLHRAEKINGSDRVVIRDKLIGLMDVRSVQSDNIAENACGDDGGGCSHLCLRNAQSYSCACPTGITMKNGSNKICEHQPLNYILYTTKTNLARISLDTGEFWEVTLPVYKLDHVIDVDFHYEKQLILYTDAGHKTIQSVNMRNLSEKHDIIKDDLVTPNGIAVDWISNIIYWADEGRKVVECADLEGTIRKNIAHTNLTGPRSVAVFPRKGYLYWSVWGPSPCIEQAFLDGSERKVIIEDGLGFPHGLTVDFKARRIYWTDAKWDKIETADLYGKNRLQLVHSSTPAKLRPFGLTLMDDYIYWTDWYHKKICRADKSNGKNPTDVRENLVGAMGITIVSESKQKGWNPCAVDNGGCTHFCFFKLTNYTCGCPDHPTETPCKTEPKSWVPLIHPDGKDEYEDEDNEDSYPNNVDFDDMYTDQSHKGPSDRQLYIMILVPVSSFILLGIILITILVLFKTTRKKYLYATGRSVMTFSNPNYYTSNAEPSGSTTNVDKKPFLWKRLKYDKSQERVYEEKTGSSSPEVASLIPTVLTPSSSNCEAITPELERSPSVTPLHRVNSLTPVA